MEEFNNNFENEDIKDLEALDGVDNNTSSNQAPQNTNTQPVNQNAQAFNQAANVPNQNQYVQNTTYPNGYYVNQNQQYPNGYQNQYGQPVYYQQPATPVQGQPVMQQQQRPVIPSQGQPVTQQQQRPFTPNQGQPVMQQQYSQNPYRPNVQNYGQQNTQYNRPVNTNNIEYNPYTGKFEEKKKQKTKASVIVLISIISTLLVAFIIGFVVLLINSSGPRYDINSKATTSTEEIPYYNFGGDDSSIFGYEGNSAYQFETYSVEIELQEDKGQALLTNKDNVADPNKDFKDIKSESEPKDKDSKEYTTESAYTSVSPAVVAVQCYEKEITNASKDIIAEGTGTVISSDGYIVTNAHVIGNSSEYKINILFNDSSSKEAKVVGIDTRTDIAVLKVDAKDLEYVKFADSDKISVGSDVIAIGNPGGSTFQNSLTKGSVSFVGRELSTSSLVKYIQTDASINPGNSGGPLCNVYGQVIGLNTAKIASTEYEGMGFAIPSNTVIEIANDLIHYGYVQNRVMLGITGIEVSQEENAYYGIPYGIAVAEVVEGGPLEDKGVSEGDILVSIDDTNTESFSTVFGILSEHKPGDKITLTFATQTQQD